MRAACGGFGPKNVEFSAGTPEIPGTSLFVSQVTKEEYLRTITYI